VKRKILKIPRPPYAPRLHSSSVSIKINDNLWSCNVLGDMSIAFAKNMIQERAERIKILKEDKENLQWQIDTYYPDMSCIPPFLKTCSDDGK
jgi:hypothetical protein